VADVPSGRSLTPPQETKLEEMVISLVGSLFNGVCYVTTLSVSRLCSVSDRMINEYGAVGGMGVSREY
jgi:hypothetical protein